MGTAVAKGTRRLVKTTMLACDGCSHCKTAPLEGCEYRDVLPPPSYERCRVRDLEDNVARLTALLQDARRERTKET